MAGASALSILETAFKSCHAAGEDGYPVFSIVQAARRLVGLSHDCVQGHSTPQQWLANAVAIPLVLPPWYAAVGGWPTPVRVACMPVLVWSCELAKGAWGEGTAEMPRYPPGRSQCKGVIRLDYALVWMALGE